jgi:putative ABC transport system ATP-binding protein
MSLPLIKVEDIRRTFKAGRKELDVLRGVSFEADHGDFLVIFGPSGCGKSTLLNIISGIDTPTSGKVSINGKSIFALDEEDRGIFRSKNFGIVHQLPYWIKSLNVVENVAMPLIISGVRAKYALKKAEEVIAELKISDLAKQSPMLLSGGEQQKVGIARALVSNPSIIVADEPTGNLDSTASDEIIGLFSMLNVRQRRTVLLVTHNQAYWDIGSRRIEIRDGLITKEVKH